MTIPVLKPPPADLASRLAYTQTMTNPYRENVAITTPIRHPSTGSVALASFSAAVVTPFSSGPNDGFTPNFSSQLNASPASSLSIANSGPIGSINPSRGVSIGSTPKITVAPSRVLSEDEEYAAIEAQLLAASGLN